MAQAYLTTAGDVGAGGEGEEEEVGRMGAGGTKINYRSLQVRALRINVVISIEK